MHHVGSSIIPCSNTVKFSLVNIVPSTDYSRKKLETVLADLYNYVQVDEFMAKIQNIIKIMHSL